MRFNEGAGLDTSQVSDQRASVARSRGVAAGSASSASAQRQKWYTTGYRTGDPARCDIVATDDLG